MRANQPIGQYLGRGDNSFGLLRIFAASAVVVSHAWTTVGGDHVPEPLQTSTGFTLGWHAVNLFFALSGLLIAGSLENGRSIPKFAWSRFLRIFPGLIVVITLTLVVAAIVSDTSQWNSSHITEYLIRNLLLVGSSATLPGVFASLPSPDVINVPLWTLKYEVLAYISAAGLTLLSWRFSRLFQMRYVSIAIMVVCAVVLMSAGAMMTHGPFEHTFRLFFAFYLGVAVWYWRDQFKTTASIMILIALVNAIFLSQGVYYAPLQILAVAYFAFWFGTLDFGRPSKLADRQDYSYGVYIIGFPVQQAVMVYSGIANPWFNFSITLLIVLPLAALSWNLIEKPALKLKKINRIKSVARLRTLAFENGHLFRPTPVPVTAIA